MSPASAHLINKLGPLQKSMIQASLRAPRSGIYLVQDVCELTGTIDLELLRCSFPRDGEVKLHRNSPFDQSLAQPLLETG